MNRGRVAAIVAGAVLVALFGGRWLALRYTEAVWFADLGLRGAFWSVLLERLGWRACVLAAAGVWFSVHLLAVVASIGAVHLPHRIGDLEITEAVPRRVLRGAALGVAVVLAVTVAAAFGDIVEPVRLWRASTPLGLPEPVLGRDASFYIGELPLLATLHLAAAATVVLTVLAVAGLYAVTGNLVVRRRRLSLTPHARAHLAAILAACALVVAWGLQLDAYRIVGGGGSRDGALSAVDRSLRVPASTVLAALGLVLAVVTALWVRWGAGALVAALWGLFIALGVGARIVAPLVADLSRRDGGPTVALALTEYASRYGRAGFGVLDVTPEPLPRRPGPALGRLDDLAPATRGVSSWALEPTILGPRLAAASADPSRLRRWTTSVAAPAPPGAHPRLVALAVAETDALALLRAEPRPSWTESHRGRLAWGEEPLLVRLEPSTEADAGAFSPLGDTVRAGTPPVRFLAHPAELSVLGENARLPGETPVGIRLRGLFRRLLLAWALQSPPLLGRRTSAGDRVLFWRDLPGRLARLYPFAEFEPPRAALAGGRLVWTADGFIVSDRFPLAARANWRERRVNFVRAAYLATVDATSGATRLFVRSPDFGFAAHLARRWGVPAAPDDSLPPQLRDQIGYPHSLLSAQAEVLAAHHDGPDTERWSVAAPGSVSGESAGRVAVPTVARLDLAGRDGVWRLVPLSDAGGNRLVAFVAGADGLRPPVPRLLATAAIEYPTPAAASSRLASSPAVVGAVALASGREGAVRRGSVNALPVAGTVAYAQVIYAATRLRDGAFEPAAVALLVGGRVGVGPDAPSAARALARSGGAVVADAAGADTSLGAARAAFRALESAAQRGDWPAFGRALDALRRALGLAPRA